MFVVGGKTSHLFLRGEDGWWYQSLVPGAPNSRYFCFVFCREFEFLYVRTWFVSATNNDCIFIEWSADWMVDEGVVFFTILKYTHKTCGLATLCY